MDFFNCKKTLQISEIEQSFEENCIYNIDTSNLCNDKSIYNFIKQLDKLYFKGKLYSIDNINYATKYTINEIMYKNPIYCGIVSDYSNHLAGTRNTFDDLTTFGKWAIQQLSSNKIMIDLANMSEKSFMTTLGISNYTSIITDAGLSSLYGRDILKPYQEKMLVDMGSLICLSLNKNNISIKGIAESVAIFVDKFGANNLCISNTNLKPKQFQKILEMFDIYLRSYGISSIDIQKIMYGNMTNFIDKNYIEMSLTKKSI